MNYLITGATGDIGGRVVRNLLQAGHRPRIFVRNTEKARALFGDRVEIAVGDLTDPASLAPALRGIHALFLVSSGPELALRDAAAAAAAKAAGVKLLVKLSSMDAQQQVGTGAWHAKGEEAIRASGIPYTFVEPTGFMSNALGWAESIKKHRIVRAPTGEGRIPFIHPADIAAVATQALVSGKYEGEALAISGPVALNYAEMSARIGAAIGKVVLFEPVTEDDERRYMLECGDPEPIIAAHMSIYRAIREGRLARVTDTVERVLGRKPHTFEDWAKENAEAFL